MKTEKKRWDAITTAQGSLAWCQHVSLNGTHAVLRPFYTLGEKFSQLSFEVCPACQRNGLIVGRVMELYPISSTD